MILSSFGSVTGGAVDKWYQWLMSATDITIHQHDSHCHHQPGTVMRLDPARLLAELDAGRLIIASVHPEIRRPRNDPPKTGGHLVLVTGHADELVTFRNPSGHTPEAGVATLPMPVFDRFAARRGIALGPFGIGARTLSHPPLPARPPYPSVTG
jgi:hypothetical protein